MPGLPLIRFKMFVALIACQTVSTDDLELRILPFKLRSLLCLAQVYYVGTYGVADVLPFSALML